MPHCLCILQDYLQDIVPSFGYQTCIITKNSKNILLSEITYSVK